MNVLFLTLLDFKSLQDRNLYTDLLRCFVKNGHDVYVISPLERRHGEKTQIVEEPHSKLLRLKTPNLQKAGILEKGFGTVLVPYLYRRGVDTYFRDVTFDLVLYSTPPITLVGVIGYIKKRDQARTYLLLKDIFPQNAVDIGLMRTTGLKGLVYRYFRKKEQALYRVSDRIGCMSQANVAYVVAHNPEIDPSVVEICPNCIEVDEHVPVVMPGIRAKYGIPEDCKVFIYGGNLGKPQGVPFLIECLKSKKDDTSVHFVVVGDGTDYKLLETIAGQSNATVIRRLPKEEYDALVAACDAGMIFLDYRFTIPNYPSRLLGYLQAGLPVLAATDESSDIGAFLEQNGAGMRCCSNSVEQFRACVERMCAEKYDRETILGVLKDHYDVDRCYSTITGGCA